MENQILGYIFMALFIAFSYFFMGKAIKNSSRHSLCCMGTFRDYSYTFSFFYSFKESLTLTQILGIVLSIVGIIMINIGEVKE